MHNVLVTGGSRGLGLAIASGLAKAGYRAIAIARGESPQLQGARETACAQGQGAIEFRPCDLSEVALIPALVRGIRADFGPIYGLVNNAGLGGAGMLGTMRDKDIESLIRLNTLSPITLTKYVARSMMTQRQGRIVNISSIVAATGYSGLSVYSATKASLVGFTRSLARELGELGITVNAVAPGFIDTAMTEELSPAQREQIARRSALKRMADAEDVARSVEFLLGAGARNITGIVLTVDAGNTA
ncbi:MAG TPA: SDR family NAD(P)-dependent oxidoreductase, partial [Steroidobacteraceae bacterium]|nr:SDR family NAD(P)-dependent oxidoreductase [Steroidobacteraceae bacterium]